MEENSHKVKQSQRIQTSILSKAEKKALNWLAARQPAWVTSDMLTAVGCVGTVLIALGYALSGKDVYFLWLATLGLFVNWYGDSLDGTLARYRGTQRPTYGFFVDHMVDCMSEVVMFVGLGLSPLRPSPAQWVFPMPSTTSTCCVPTVRLAKMVRRARLWCA